MLANFLELNSKWLRQSSGKEKENFCLLFPSSRKRENRQFHIAVVHRRQIKVQKSVLHVQSCCFPCLNLLILCRSRCGRPRRCVNSLMSFDVSDTSTSSLLLPRIIFSDKKNKLFNTTGAMFGELANSIHQRYFQGSKYCLIEEG